MRFVSRMPVNIDYVLGVLMVLSGAMQMYTWFKYVDVLSNSSYLLSYMTNVVIIPYEMIFVMGVVLIVLPHKNLRRSIWLCSFMLGLELIAQGYQEYYTFNEVYEAGGPLPGDELYYFCVEIMTFAVVRFGCGIAALINSVMFAAKKVRSIYPLIFAVVLTVLVDYLEIVVYKEFYMEWDDLFEQVLSVIVPHMVLYGVFALLFTSDEVSWYTVKGDIIKAINRLKTVNATFDLYNLSRDQLILLMQCTGDCSMHLSNGRFIGILEVRCTGGGKDLVFCRSGVGSLAGAFYMHGVTFVLPDTISKSRYVDIYSTDRVHIRMDLAEPHRKIIRPKVVKAQVALGYLPKYRYTVSNACLYHMVDGDGEVMLKGGPRPPVKLSKAVMSHDEGGRMISVYRQDGSLFCSMHVVAAVPQERYGAYARLYVYGDMGRYMVFMVAKPRRDQAEKPDTDRRAQE